MSSGCEGHEGSVNPFAEILNVDEETNPVVAALIRPVFNYVISKSKRYLHIYIRVNSLQYDYGKDVNSHD